jgi:hypothetical protein
MGLDEQSLINRVAYRSNKDRLASVIKAIATSLVPLRRISVTDRKLEELRSSLSPSHSDSDGAPAPFTQHQQTIRKPGTKLQRNVRAYVRVTRTDHSTDARFRCLFERSQPARFGEIHFMPQNSTRSYSKAYPSGLVMLPRIYVSRPCQPATFPRVLRRLTLTGYSRKR